MSFLSTLASAFKGGGEARVPLAHGYVSPWAVAYDRARPGHHFDYDSAIKEGFLANPIAQRAVRIVAEAVGSAPLSPVDPRLGALVGATSAGQSLIETLAAQLLLHGNRIPALTFEVLADAQPLVTLGQLVPDALTIPGLDQLEHMLGFTDEGGPLLDSLEAINRAYPLICVTGGTTVEIDLQGQVAGDLPLLPEPLAVSSNDGATGAGRDQFRRAAATDPAPVAMRYYDRDRDYQPGVQRAIGLPASGREIMLDLPAAMISGGARQIVNSNAQSRRWQSETISWTIAELDPALGPGVRVNIPQVGGVWSIAGWEWSDQGIELTLERLPPLLASAAPADPGRINPPIDLPAVPTVLKVLELPWDGTGSQNVPSFFAAVSASAGNWSGAALFVEQADGLVPLDAFANRRSVMGVLTAPLAASAATNLEPAGELLVDLAGDDLILATTTSAGLTAGANRLIVGREIVQFMAAVQTGPRSWRLSGLLRGRGGTEAVAGLGHAAGTDVILIDETLIALDPALIAETGAMRIAAIGLADDAPVFATLEADGLSRRPPPPVHARRLISANGDWELCWSRRVRGQWRWPDFIETPLIEEQEAYLVGVGSIDQPLTSWQVQSPRLNLEASAIASLAQSANQSPVWVRQLGTYGQSQPALIAQLP